MTTNSPNPVDGDVQAMIRNIQRRIKNTKRWLSANKSIGNPESEAVELLLIYETALASLTAEPGIFEWRFKDIEGTLPSPWIALGMDKLEQCRNTFGDMADYRFWFPKPPAQLLRPVEKPTTKCIGWVKESIQEHDEKWISAIREAGYEVKS